MVDTRNAMKGMTSEQTRPALTVSSAFQTAPALAFTAVAAP